ncbi:MAG: hypothetical protein A3H91_09220 [Gammaproteobacteria bacterium RIFCSPLOWO2_02_FULL_61_13]|nr:MAG: hypothetical protein A3H91_09220 [Gammaproteobacteria bacterium RIFCSPLOWO2_02_FULL_61_13]
MKTAAARYEYATRGDPSRNYCLWDYAPATPAEDKFRSVNLLYQSFEYAGIDPRAYDMVEALREAIGSFRTVFGVKQLPGRLAWEYYFYDYARQARAVSITKVLAALRPHARCAVRANENLPYFMFSLDLDAELARGGRDMDVVHMYVGNPGSAVSSGIAYAVREGATVLENFYFFFDAESQQEAAAEKIRSSVYFDADRISMDEVLVPELKGCQTICVANKQTHDCVYFSGIGVGQLLHFLDRLGYPPPIVSFVRENRGLLDHLLFDVGFDYRVESGRLAILKSGYYGVF